MAAPTLDSGARAAGWCIVDREEGFAALDRMRAPGVTTGFHPNDD